jgi:hypothetical protein
MKYSASASKPSCIDPPAPGWPPVFGKEMAGSVVGDGDGVLVGRAVGVAVGVGVAVAVTAGVSVPPPAVGVGLCVTW